MSPDTLLLLVQIASYVLPVVAAGVGSWKVANAYHPAASVPSGVLSAVKTALASKQAKDAAAQFADLLGHLPASPAAPTVQQPQAAAK